MAVALQVESSVIANGDSEVHVVVGEGELDIATLGALQGKLDALADGTGRRVLVDLGALEFIDSPAIAALYHASASFAHVAVVVPADSQVARILEICGMHEMLPIFHDRGEALRALA